MTNNKIKFMDTNKQFVTFILNLFIGVNIETDNICKNCNATLCEYNVDKGKIVIDVDTPKNKQKFLKYIQNEAPKNAKYELK